MQPHKHDRRGASEEGKFAQDLYEFCCKDTGRGFKTASIKEDCAGIDAHINMLDNVNATLSKSVDVKGRKFRMPPNTCWIETSASGKAHGTGWAYKPKWIAQLMVFEQDGYLTNCIFGEYHTSDLVELMDKKVDYNSKASYGKIYELYTRWTDGQHRGTMTIVSYEDLQSLKSFSTLAVPRHKWDEVCRIYDLKGIKSCI